MSNLQWIRADLWQTLLNTRNVDPNTSPQSQGYLVMPDEADELRKGHIPSTWRRPNIMTPEVTHDDVLSNHEVLSKYDCAWSSKDSMCLVRLRADKVAYKVIAQRLGRIVRACQNHFHRIKGYPEYMEILAAGTVKREENESGEVE